MNEWIPICKLGGEPAGGDTRFFVRQYLLPVVEQNLSSTLDSTDHRYELVVIYSTL